MCLLGVGQEGLQALNSRQAHFCEWVAEQGPEAWYELLHGAC